MIDPRNPDYHNSPVSPLRSGFNYRPEDSNLKPVVSIITPFYNIDSIFDETAQSVLGQSLQQWEWIIVNDGSTAPGSLQILDAYRASDPRIRVVDHAINQGLPAARNTGAREARTQFLLYLDGDDLLEPTAAEKWLWFLESYPQYSFVGGYLVGFGAREYLWRAGFQNLEANLDINYINHIIMIRKEVVLKVGGYDESMRSGLEDWDFWVRCADQGYWGDSVPEFLHWYRTRPNHADRWEGLKKDQLRKKRQEFHHRYPHLWKGGFPKIEKLADINLIRMREDLPCLNKLEKRNPRLLLVAPWLVTGGAEKFNLDLISQLSQRGWEMTIATTLPSENPWQYEFERITPDVFPMNNFLEWGDYPSFLSYLIQSRQVDAVMLAASQEAYRLLPYLRSRFPEVPILDYIHFVTPEWMDGGFPRLSMLFSTALDLSAVTSQQVKNWMIAEGADEARIEVCTANIDVHAWHPDPQKRLEIRKQLGITDAQALILYIGRLEQQKQPRVFAKTMLRLKNENLSFISLVVGDGSLKDWLNDFVERENLRERVRFLGDTPQQRVKELMVAGDIVFLPSENEGIALTIFEGMASGVVPVGAAVGGQPELVTPECGILIPRSTEDEEAERYAQALSELIRQPEKRQKMGGACRERVVNDFSLEKMGEHMEALIYKAQQLRRESLAVYSQEELASLLGRQVAEYLRAAGTIRLREPFMSRNYMPPASASTFLYFTLRQLIYPIFGRFREKDWLIKVKSKVKSVLVKK